MPQIDDDGDHQLVLLPYHAAMPIPDGSPEPFKLYTAHLNFLGRLIFSIWLAHCNLAG